MKKKFCLGFILIFALLLCACANTAPEADAITPSTYKEPEDTIGETLTATESATEESTEEPIQEPTQAETEETQPPHSPLYLPEHTPDQVCIYFEDVVLHVEYSEGDGNPALVQKWTEPIRYRIYGDYTEEDVAILSDLFTQLNEIPGFPGIYAEEDGFPENYSIYFLEPGPFDDLFSDILNGEYAQGAIQYWYYTDTNQIHTANVGYRTDVDFESRKSILVEEIINSLGISDTELRTDSIVYQYSDENTALSDVDWLIVKLLYNPAIQCGMSTEECFQVIQELYY